MAAVVFRCDGDDRIGAGHVSRCLLIAEALRSAGSDVAIVGRVEGIAAELAQAAGFNVDDPEPGLPAGLPDSAEAAVVDSYEIGADELAAAAARRPVCMLLDEGPAPPVQAVLSYHLDAASRLELPGETTAILGAAFAPVRPAVVAARRPREFDKALVTLGGSAAGAALLEPLAAALHDLSPGLEIYVAGSAPVTPQPWLTSGQVRGGLTAQIADADVAISGAGSTPYELACAGVPALLLGLADNQIPIGEAFVAARIADFVDARGGLPPEAVAEVVRGLGQPERRQAMAKAGPAHIDGYGAFRAAAALRAFFAGQPLPRVIQYRPATAEDAALLLAWRNDPATRAASREQVAVEPDEHAAWLGRTFANPRRTLLVAEHGGTPVGTVRFDRGDGTAEIAVTVAPEARGGGIGTQMIHEATELYLHAHGGDAVVRAEIRPDNHGSLAAFERAGFRKRSSGPELELFEADRASIAAAGRG